MPHTQSRYQQDLGFPDGKVRGNTDDLMFTGATLTITRVAAGQWGIVLGTPAAQANTFALNLSNQLLRRTGFFEDIQENFGGGGIAGSAQVRNYRPDQIGSMSAAQQLQPRTAFKTKGFKLVSFDVIYLVGTLALTSATCRVDSCVFSNNVAPVVTSVLASGANGLATATQAQPYVINVPILAANQNYLITPDSDLTIEVVLTGAATSTITFYGIDAYVEYNLN